jgi:hypothetical protein
MGLFGWSLPPGCGTLPGEEPDPPCALCGEDVDHCICPECPQCGCIGDPKCYGSHGLVMTHAQRFLLAWNEAIWENEARSYDRMAEDLGYCE